MQCKNHPDVPAADRCAACAEAFCPNCLVDIQGAKYCGSCKVLAVQGNPVAAQVEESCHEANKALTWGIIGLLLSSFIFGLIFGIFAIVKGSKAKSLIHADPRLSGSGKANAAVAAGLITIVYFVVCFSLHAAHKI